MTSTYAKEELPFEVPDAIDRLIRLCVWDLWHGPIARSGDFGPDDGRPWPGFSDAVDALHTWGDKHDIGAVYYREEDCDWWTDTEPEAWQDDETGEWIEPGPYEARTGWELLLPGRHSNKLLEYVQ